MTPWTAAHQASLSLTISQTLLRFMSIALAMPSMPSCYSGAMPLKSSSPSALNLSQHHSLFQFVSCWHQLAKLLKLLVDSSNAALLHRESQIRIRSSTNGLAPGTNWGAVMGEGVATFLAAPSVPGRRALCSWLWSQSTGCRSLRDPVEAYQQGCWGTSSPRPIKAPAMLPHHSVWAGFWFRGVQS